jgi:hypothetical protein
MDVLACVSSDVPETAAEDDLASAERLGIRLIVPEDAEWPHARTNTLTTTVDGRRTVRSALDDVPPRRGAPGSGRPRGEHQAGAPVLMLARGRVRTVRLVLLSSPAS